MSELDIPINASGSQCDSNLVSMNKAYNEETLIYLLFNCRQDNWCFVHNTAEAIDNKIEKDFGFMPLSVIRPSLFRNTVDLNIKDNLQLAIKANTL